MDGSDEEGRSWEKKHSQSHSRSPSVCGCWCRSRLDRHHLERTSAAYHCIIASKCASPHRRQTHASMILVLLLLHAVFLLMSSLSLSLSLILLVGVSGGVQRQLSEHDRAAGLHAMQDGSLRRASRYLTSSELRRGSLSISRLLPSMCRGIYAFVARAPPSPFATIALLGEYAESRARSYCS